MKVIIHFFIYFLLGYLQRTVQTQGFEKVNVTVSYESLCSDSKRFFHEQFVPTFEKLSNYMNVELLPFGNVLISGLPDEIKFECQHGPSECYRNKIHACFIEFNENMEDNVKFISCAFDVKKNKKHDNKCFDDKDFNNKIKICADGVLGEALLLKMALETPAHSFIPWIVVNGKSGDDFNQLALKHFMEVICNEISGEKPKECQQRILMRGWRSSKKITEEKEQ